MKIKIQLVNKLMNNNQMMKQQETMMNFYKKRLMSLIIFLNHSKIRIKNKSILKIWKQRTYSIKFHIRQMIKMILICKNNNNDMFFI